MSPLRNLPVRSSPPSASSADGKEDATTAGQQPTHSPRYSPTQASAALPEFTAYNSPQRDPFGLWIVQDFLSSEQLLPSEPTDATFRQALPQSWSALMEESAPNLFSGGPGAALNMDPTAPPQPYVDPRMLPVFGSASAQQAPSLTEPSVIPADSQPSTALGPAHGKRSLPVEPDTAQQLAKRPLRGEGVEPDAASGDLNPAWPPTRDAGKPIVCTIQVVSSLFHHSTKDRLQQLKHHECVGQVGGRAVIAACAEKGGTLVSDAPPGTYKFENVVLEKGAQVGRSRSDTLPTEQRIHAVYLQFQKGKDGTDELMDFHIHVPATVPTQPGKYSNTEKAILSSIRRNELQREEKQMAAAYRKENPRPDYTFQKEKKMKKIFESNTALLNRLGYHYAHELDQTLRDCKEVLGDLPHEGDNDLILSRNGTTVKVRWVFENEKTADLIFAESKEELQQKIRHRELTKRGIEGNKRAKPASKATWNKNVLWHIASTHGPELQDLGWTDREQWKGAVRDISLHCEAAGKTPKDGESAAGTEIEGVGEFKLKGVGPAKKDVQVLRWVDRGELREIKFIHEDKREKAMSEMKNFIGESLKRRNP